MGYTKVNARVLLGGNSVGVATLFLASYYREEESAGVHSFLPVNKQGENSAGVATLFLSSISKNQESNSVGVHSFLPVSKQGEKSAGYTLSFQH